MRAYIDAMRTRSRDVNDGATLWWDAGTGCLRYIEQTLLPNEYRVVECRDTDRLATAIRRLEIRGAPALGVAGAYGVALAAPTRPHHEPGAVHGECHRGGRDASGLPARLPSTSAWGIDRVLAASGRPHRGCRPHGIALEEAEAIAT